MFLNENRDWFKYEEINIKMHVKQHIHGLQDGDYRNSVNILHVSNCHIKI